MRFSSLSFFTQKKYILALAAGIMSGIVVWIISNFFVIGDPTLQRAAGTPDHKTERAVRRAKVHYDRKASYKGYTLLSFQYSGAVYLVSMKGKVVHEWSAPFRKVWPDAKHIHRAAAAKTFVETAHVYPNGDLLVQYSGIGDTPYGYGIAKLDKYSNVLWRYSENAHHDFHVRPSDGHIFALTQAIIKSPLDGLGFLKYPILNDYVVELSPEGKELRKISIAEAYKLTPYMYDLAKTKRTDKLQWDLLHTNSVMVLDKEMATHFPMFKEGDILVSIRNLSTVGVIDGQTHQFKRLFKGSWHMQHAASFLDNGNLMLLDNLGPKRPGFRPPDKQSRVLEISPETSEITWSYKGNDENPFRSPARGRTSRLPNGNTLIADSMYGRTFEVTPDGRVAWRMQLPTEFDKKKKKERSKLWIITSKRYITEELPFLLEKKDRNEQ